MKKETLVLLLLALILFPVAATGSRDASAGGSATVYPPGDIMIWETGQPQFRNVYYEGFLNRNRDIAPNVNIQAETLKTMADGQQKIAMYALSGDRASMPEIIMMDTVGVVQLASAGLLVDMTDFYTPLGGEFVDGAARDATVKGRIYGLPDAVRPQLLFYNAEIFEKYNIDPAMMSTFDGYYEAGRLLKERSNGQAFLSYVDPGSYTWRYWGRRGLMPQANARIWDEQGNIIIGSNPGAKLALGFFDRLYNGGGHVNNAVFLRPGGIRICEIPVSGPELALLFHRSDHDDQYGSRCDPHVCNHAEDQSDKQPVVPYRAQDCNGGWYLLPPSVYA
jgi:multiple sugar transport system substrate-binding protein